MAALAALVRFVLLIVIVVRGRSVDIIVPLDYGLVINGVGVFQGMNVVLLVDDDLAQVGVKATRVYALVARLTNWKSALTRSLMLISG